MKKYNLNEMIKGWFVGDFEPNVMYTDKFEVAVKKYKKNEKEQKHYHKEAEEITVIISGRVLMNDIEYKENDIILIGKNEATDFIALEDTVTVVVKNPSVKGDKYVSEI